MSDPEHHHHLIWLTYVTVYRSRMQDLAIRWWLERIGGDQQ
ncbi:hypothetical protein [Meiothermus sp.]|nr:hypothetical protein [Meiothermus sp.]GIW33752.1 MAG: hypothetical protein KatS3mg072_1085 [Meiothermus sp.]